jgi:CBS domain-containing protein
MDVAAILRSKGGAVETIDPAARLDQALRRLADRGIGALVVTPDGATVLGLLAERDAVRALARRGVTAFSMAVREAMSGNVPVCTPRDNLTSVMATMTRTRQRHLPVLDEGRLCGIVSIGDVVKHRLDELQLEANVLRDAYLAHR